MDEKDRKYVEEVRNGLGYPPDAANPAWCQAEARKLLDIIDRMKAKMFRMGVILGDLKIEVEKTRIRGIREVINTNLIEENAALKEQLRAIKKVGEPFGEFGKHFPLQGDDYETAYVTYAGLEARLTVGNHRRLAELLDEVDDE